MTDFGALLYQLFIHTFGPDTIHWDETSDVEKAKWRDIAEELRAAKADQALDE